MCEEYFWVHELAYYSVHQDAVNVVSDIVTFAGERFEIEGAIRSV